MTMNLEREKELILLRETRLRYRREKESEGWCFRMDYWVRTRLILLCDYFCDCTERWEPLSRMFDAWSEKLSDGE